MIALYFVGVFASYLLVLHRERKTFPWRIVALVLLFLALLLTASVYVGVARYGFKLVPHWPFLMR